MPSARVPSPRHPRRRARPLDPSRRARGSSPRGEGTCSAPRGASLVRIQPSLKGRGGADKRKHPSLKRWKQWPIAQTGRARDRYSRRRRFDSSWTRERPARSRPSRRVESGRRCAAPERTPAHRQRRRRSQATSSTVGSLRPAAFARGPSARSAVCGSTGTASMSGAAHLGEARDAQGVRMSGQPASSRA